MHTLVIGGGASGKSEYAEELFSALNSPKFYVATMMPYGEDGLARIEKHRQARRDRGFHTIEHYRAMDKLVLPERGAVLLECLGNLAANELFSDFSTEEQAKTAILTGIEALALKTDNLVAVTNDVFSGGSNYDDDTLKYIRVLGFVNRELAGRFDKVIEVICGISVVLKG